MINPSVDEAESLRQNKLPMDQKLSIKTNQQRAHSQTQHQHEGLMSNNPCRDVLYLFN